MRRIAIWIASTVTIVVLLFGYHTSTNRTATVNGGTVADTGQQSSTNGSGSSGGSPPKDQSTGQGSGGSGDRGSSSKTSSARKTVTGDLASTRWGPVQIKIVVKNQKITSVGIVQAPDGNPHDNQINSYALPILVRETISAQSAHIDMISGATITSGGYIQSLQSALDQAGI